MIMSIVHTRIMLRDQIAWVFEARSAYQKLTHSLVYIFQGIMLKSKVILSGEFHKQATFWFGREGSPLHVPSKFDILGQACEMTAF